MIFCPACVPAAFESRSRRSFGRIQQPVTVFVICSFLCSSVLLPVFVVFCRLSVLWSVFVVNGGRGGSVWERDHPAHRRLRPRSRQRCRFQTAGRRECTHIETAAAVISRASGESRVNKIYPRRSQRIRGRLDLGNLPETASGGLWRMFASARYLCKGHERTVVVPIWVSLTSRGRAALPSPPPLRGERTRRRTADASRGPNDTVRSGAQEVQHRVRGLAPMAGPLLVSLTLSPGLAGPRYCCLLQPLRRWPAQTQRKRSAMRPCCCMLGGCGSHCAGGAGGQTRGQPVAHHG